MNSHYNSIIVDYIDLTDCDFQYTLEWYRENGFKLESELFFKHNKNAPTLEKCSVWVKTACPQDVINSCSTRRQFEWLLNNFEEHIGQNGCYPTSYMSINDWREVLSIHPLQQCSGLGSLIGYTQFPVEDFIDLPVGNEGWFIHGMSRNPDRILKTAVSQYNDWYWTDERLVYAKWERLACSPKLSVDFWKHYIPTMCSPGLAAMSPVLDETFWRSYLNTRDTRVNPAYLTINPSLSESFVEEYLLEPDDVCINWSYLCSYNHTLPETFWERYQDHINWDDLSTNESVPESFWEKHLADVYEDIDWALFSSLSSLSEDFWKRNLPMYSDYVEWKALMSRTFSVIFWEWCIVEFSDKIMWDVFCCVQNLPLSFWERHRHCVRDVLVVNHHCTREIMKREVNQFLS